MVSQALERLQVADDSLHAGRQAAAYLALRRLGCDDELEHALQGALRLREQIAHQAGSGLAGLIGELGQKRGQARREDHGQAGILGWHSAASVAQVLHFTKKCGIDGAPSFGGTRKEVPACSSAVCGHRCRWRGSMDGRSADVGAAAPCDPALTRRLRPCRLGAAAARPLRRPAYG